MEESGIQFQANLPSVSGPSGKPELPWLRNVEGLSPSQAAHVGKALSNVMSATNPEAKMLKELFPELRDHLEPQLEGTLPDFTPDALAHLLEQFNGRSDSQQLELLAGKLATHFSA